MEDYRKEAQQKYEKTRLERLRLETERHEFEKQELERQDLERQELERQERERQELERKDKERLELERNEFNEQWMIWVALLSENTLYSLHELNGLVEKIPMTQDYLYERMVELVEQLNTIQETKKIDATEARLIHEAMLKLIQLTGIDIEIQAMDTSQDEDYARHVEERELEQLQDIPNQLQNIPEQVPICSIEKRIGLNVNQLREIARIHDIKIKGNKRELCLMLSHHGLVRLV
jgi:hypothetical protein